MTAPVWKKPLGTRIWQEHWSADSIVLVRRLLCANSLRRPFLRPGTMHPINYRCELGIIPGTAVGVGKARSHKASGIAMRLARSARVILWLRPVFQDQYVRNSEYAAWQNARQRKTFCHEIPGNFVRSRLAPAAAPAHDLHRDVTGWRG